MREVALSQEQLFATLRAQGLDHLGCVKRAYMEANGNFSVLKQAEPQPGLTLLPSWDQDFINEQPKVPDTYACCHCGFVRRSPGHAPNTACDACTHREWSPAVTSAA